MGSMDVVSWKLWFCAVKLHNTYFDSNRVHLSKSVPRSLQPYSCPLDNELVSVKVTKNSTTYPIFQLRCTYAIFTLWMSVKCIYRRAVHLCTYWESSWWVGLNPCIRPANPGWVASIELFRSPSLPSLIVPRLRRLEHRRANSRASIQHRPDSQKSSEESQGIYVNESCTNAN